VLLDAGSALGNNCGPLLISKREIPRAEVESGGVRIAIPGRLTTANFLCGLAFPQAQDKTPIIFSDIEPAVLDGRFDAGLIIHENRFHLRVEGAEEDHRSRRVLGSRDRRSDSAGWHRRAPGVER
jgi:1,4-dihydroxy-6-naphthoate synthase